MAVTLSQIVVYPIKSCGGVSLDEATVSPIGLAGDREWQFVDDDRNGVTQRQHRVLATVRPEPLEDGGLRLTAPGRPAIDVDRDGSSTTVKSLFGVPVEAIDAGDDAARWFTDLTGASGRLVAMRDPGGWRLPEEFDLFGQGAPFSDAAPILVASRSSADWLAERASEPFGIDRFRANLIVSGAPAWDEDTWDRFAIGPVSLRAAAPWPRCQIPQVDQESGDAHKEPAKVLRAHRWCTEAPGIEGGFRSIVEGSGLFGIACTIEPAGAVVRLGDELTVESTAAPVLAMD
ncbi:MOSC domain-containing protein [Ilumatobacter nonamiensis]|uniref:MOSC domain-containing protein n=1 Tax=Ilumatobacter nonamiensis TaxID=467093 RepID=UPI00034798B6|nr:MOSC N-terminal beta barrel domain-containing protein [Ilumatobacter nonamiensis]